MNLGQPLKDLKVLVALIVVILTIAGWGIWWERTIVKKKDFINMQIIQAEVNRVLLLAPYKGKLENAPSDVQAIHRMLLLESTRLRGG